MKSDNKTSPSHLKRNTYFYIHQSIQHQIRDNIESQQRQYELTIQPDQHLSEDATVVIDDDPSRSGSRQKIETIFTHILIKHLCSSWEGSKEHEK